MQLKNIITRFQSISSYLFWALICVVTTLLLMEQSASIAGFPHIDKVIHATLFAMLTAIGYLAYTGYSIQLYLGLIAYGMITEISQSAFTVTRFASIYDWFADILGILLCILVIKMIKLREKVKTTYVR